MFLKIFYLFIFKIGGREKQRERNIDVWEKHLSVAYSTSPAGDLERKPDMCSDQESNLQPFDLQDNNQPTEPHQSGLRKLHISCNLLFGSSLGHSCFIIPSRIRAKVFLDEENTLPLCALIGSMSHLFYSIYLPYQNCLILCCPPHSLKPK